jgi:hypothetical protein
MTAFRGTGCYISKKIKSRVKKNKNKNLHPKYWRCLHVTYTWPNWNWSPTIYKTRRGSIEWLVQRNGRLNGAARRYGIFSVALDTNVVEIISLSLFRFPIRWVAFGVRENGKLNDVASDKDRWTWRFIKRLRGGRPARYSSRERQIRTRLFIMLGNSGKKENIKSGETAREKYM